MQKFIKLIVSINCYKFVRINLIAVKEHKIFRLTYVSVFFFGTVFNLDKSTVIMKMTLEFKRT